jgi:DNA-binding transcriptional MerR regulator
MQKTESYTIKQLADLAGISVRTLHYYDQIGLVKPERIAENGYRFYGKQQLLLLQQVLFFRELDFSLDQIRNILETPGVDLVKLLQTHKFTLKKEIERLMRLIETVNKTIKSLEGKTEMAENEYFKGFSDEKQAEYQKYAEEHWDRKLVEQSSQRWNKMNNEEKQALLARGERITLEIVRSIPLGPSAPHVQELVAEWHEYINQFYDCSYEILLGLGKGYTEHPDFIAFYRKMHPEMPEFLYESIKIYCSDHGLSE